jgi:hypothetical protein
MPQKRVKQTVKTSRFGSVRSESTEAIQLDNTRKLYPSQAAELIRARRDKIDSLASSKPVSWLNIGNGVETDDDPSDNRPSITDMGLWGI